MPENGSISINSPMESIVSENGEVIEPCLEIILARYMEKEKVTIVKSKIEPAAARGTNFISNAWRVTFDYTINDENGEMFIELILEHDSSDKLFLFSFFQLNSSTYLPPNFFLQVIYIKKKIFFRRSEI